MAGILRGCPTATPNGPSPRPRRWTRPRGRGAAEASAPGAAAGGSGPAPARRDPIAGELRRAGLLPLLVLHLLADGPSYGNQLIEQIGELTGGLLSVNPNTMYPLLRALEQQGLAEGAWEHPERRSRRFYAITPAGAGRARSACAARSPRGWTRSPPRSSGCAREVLAP